MWCTSSGICGKRAEFLDGLPLYMSPGPVVGGALMTCARGTPRVHLFLLLVISLVLEGNCWMEYMLHEISSQGTSFLTRECGVLRYFNIIEGLLFFSSAVTVLQIRRVQSVSQSNIWD